MKKRIPSKQGFTLIEVILALVIVGVGLSSLLLAVVKCQSVVVFARTREEARGLIRRVEVENPIDPKKITEGTDSGRFDGIERYTWQREITMVDEEDRPGLFLVTTRILWSERSRTASEEITTYNYAPESESVTRKF